MRYPSALRPFDSSRRILDYLRTKLLSSILILKSISRWAYAITWIFRVFYYHFFNHTLKNVWKFNVPITFAFIIISDQCRKLKYFCYSPLSNSDKIRDSKKKFSNLLRGNTNVADWKLSTFFKIFVSRKTTFVKCDFRLLLYIS